MNEILEKIKELLNKKGVKEMTFTHLVEIKSEVDADGEELPIVANTIRLEDNDTLSCYDQRDEDVNGEFEPIFNIAELPIKKQKELLWALTN